MNNVRQILASKGSKVITYHADHDVGTACKVLREHNIGALPIVDSKGHLTGIFSERDVVHLVAEMEENALSMPVSTFMTENVVTIGTGESVATARNLMKKGRFRHLPVVENGELVGMISLSDVVESFANEMETLARQYEAYITAG